jgi:hypothetical protein
MEAKWSNMDRMLLKWFKQKEWDCTGEQSRLMAEVKEPAKLLNEKDFVCTTGWFDRF